MWGYRPIEPMWKAHYIPGTHVLASLPVLPLPNVVLLPGMVLPLNVHEPRYLELVDFVRTHGMHLGVPLTLPPAPTQDAPPLEPVFGLGKLVFHTVLGDGRVSLILDVQAVARRALHGELTVELKCGQPLKGKVAWVQSPNVGLVFDKPIDVIAMLSQSEDGPRPRMPRIETSSFCTLRDGANIVRARACDISQGGIKVETAASFARNAEVVVSLPGLPPQPGVVRWTSEGCAGITFNRLLPLPSLIDWLKARSGTRNAA